MSELSHSARRTTVRTLVTANARRLARAKVFFGHGSDNPADEAAALVWHALRLPYPARAQSYARRVGARASEQVRALIDRRIHERIPAAYLIGRARFAGLQFYIDPRVLIPRSPLAELIERGFAPWIDPARVRRILDVGTGSGCIAIACARAFPHARLDALDVSLPALEVARINVRRHRLARRVRLLRSDHFGALAEESYDIIVSNPPYVGARELGALPAEYRHEPRVALASGRGGLDSIRIILRDAARHLKPRGILVVEAGNTEIAVRRAFPGLPFTWLHFERGGGGVFLLTAEQLHAG
jgi:ribosomal protein L3 glutamine methyltransferase